MTGLQEGPIRLLRGKQRDNERVLTQNHKTLRIAFPVLGGQEWPAGRIYLKDLVHALHDFGQNEVQVILLASESDQGISEFSKNIGADELILLKSLGRSKLKRGIDRVGKNLFVRDWILERNLNRAEVNVLFSYALGAPLYKYPNIASLTWIPDFQHRRLPELFDRNERERRNKAFIRAATQATRIIVNVQDAKRDFELFAPHLAQKVRVIHPVSILPSTIYEDDPAAILDLYNLPKKFVYMPNHFWRHKNHEQVFRAVKDLVRSNMPITIVCTGNNYDFRHPQYFHELWRQLSHWNIRDRIIWLGLVPYQHVLLLMRQSVFVLNPSLFEGWGISVEEARSLGKRLLLSDIPAHREQDPPAAAYFNLNDDEMLKRLLSEMWRNGSQGPDFELELHARNNARSRGEVYAKTFISLAYEATSSLQR